MAAPVAGDELIATGTGYAIRAKTAAEKAYPFLLNPTFVQVITSITNSGNNDLYTVAAGKRAVILTSRMYPSAGGSQYLALKRSAAYTQLSITTGMSAANVISCAGFVFEEGDSIAMNHDGAGAVNYVLGLLVFDAPTSGPRGLKTFSNLALSNGANTILTVGTGCQMLFPAVGYGAILLGGGAINATNTSVGYVMNLSGGTRSYDMNMVPTGGSAGASNLMVSALSANTATRATFTPAGLLSDGDTIVVTTNAGTATQSCWFTGYEF